MSIYQPGIMAEVPALARYLTFALHRDADPAPVLAELAGSVDGNDTVLGLGRSLLLHLGAQVDGLGDFPVHTGAAVDVPSTPVALWCWLRGDDRGELVHRTRSLAELLAPAFELQQVTDAFRYRTGFDLTGYEDGTENPQGEEAEQAAFVNGAGDGLDGSSFVAVQDWVHDLDRFESHDQESRDHIIGRRQSDNEELDDAPESAHVKRTAQESFDPEAFVLRRSMPWASEQYSGLVFVAFGRSLDAFEALLNRMVGNEDGTVDALFDFTRPLTGAYFWCPPMRDGQIDLSALGL